MKGQKPLHYGIFLGSGSIISIISAYILLFTQSSTKQSMRLFLFIGGFFIFVGIIKFLIIKIKKISTKEKKFSEHLAGIDTINKREEQIQNRFNKSLTKNDKQETSIKQKTPNKIITCPKCETLNYITSNYCHMCGMRLK